MDYLILNGKKAGIPEVREAVNYFRGLGYELRVRVTWEYGDIARYVKEAITEKARAVLIGGGDGSVNEVTNAMMEVDKEKRLPIGVIPLGTANDFANGAELPLELVPAIEFALTATPIDIDVGQVNDQYFLNMATAGFGAKVTAETPVDLKNFLGGGAYVLSGLVQALQFVPYKGQIETPEGVFESSAIIASVGNGSQAGGGQVLCPEAKLNDGLLDLLIVEDFPSQDLGVVLDEIRSIASSNIYVKRIQAPWFIAKGDSDIPINLDGEPISDKDIKIQIVEKAIALLIPENSKLLMSG